MYIACKKIIQLELFGEKNYVFQSQIYTNILQQSEKTDKNGIEEPSCKILRAMKLS